MLLNINNEYITNHVVTLGISQGEDSILDNGKRISITATKIHVNIGCARVSIDALEFLLKKHKEMFEDKSLRIIQQG